MSTVPTLYEWLGGMPALERLTAVFYARVPDDPLLGAVFARMSPDHPRHVAEFLAEVLGGPREYSARRGGHPEMVRHHLGRGLTQEQRRRWVELLLACADEIGAAADETAPMPRWGWGEVGGPYTPKPPG